MTTTALSMISTHAEQHPTSVALRTTTSVLTYRELLDRSRALAARLRAIGVKPEDPVIIMLPRSVEFVISVLGVWLAAGAYVAIDPRQPPARKQYLYRDSRAVALIRASHQDTEPSPALPVVALDTLDYHAAPGSEKPDLEPPVDPHRLAYILYTSGTTGRPKGVLVEHKGLDNLARVHRDQFGLRPGQRVLNFASPIFDASVWEILMALTAGVELVIPTHTHEADPGQGLEAFITRMNIDVMTLAPTVLASMNPAAIAQQVLVVSAGEALSEALATQWSHQHRLLNAYGPTENTVCATIGPVLPDSGAPGIGHPLPGVCVHVRLDSEREASTNDPGELIIGGAALARGYHNLPELTAKRFALTTACEHGNTRFYRTGDLAVARNDGSLAFLGRTDDQVKVRGIRIELGEIENALLRTGPVRAATVLVREDRPAIKTIVAYIVARDPGHISVPDVYDTLRQQLPDYMIPNGILVLDRLPRQLSGKIDRSQLPAPHTSAPHPDQPSTAATATQTKISKIWTRVLKLEAIAPEDDFFFLGGDSISALQVGEMVGATLGVAITPELLYEAPVLHEFATLVDQVAATASTGHARRKPIH